MPERRSRPSATRSRVPRPGQPVRGSRTGRPVMVLLDLLGRRWLLRVLWELRDGPLPWRELQRRCDMTSPNVLTSRLRDGIEARIFEKHDDGRYALTPRGRELLALLAPFDPWARAWSRELEKPER